MTTPTWAELLAAADEALEMLKVGIDDLLKAERTGHSAYTGNVEEEWGAPTEPPAARVATCARLTGCFMKLE